MPRNRGSRSEHGHHDQVLDGRGFRAFQVDYPSTYRRGAHAHETHSITLVLDGEILETAHGRDERARALSVVVKPAGTVHADVAGPRGARTVVVELPDESPLLATPNCLGSWRWLHAGPGVRPLLRLRRAFLDPVGGPDPREAVLELLGDVVAGASLRGGCVPAWVRRIREALDDRAPESQRVDELAGLVGVHPVSLTRAFRRAYGVPVTVYRRRLRLQSAVAQVVSTDRALGSIAHATGYTDQAHFCREVRNTTGLTPTRLRNVSRG